MGVVGVACRAIIDGRAGSRGHMRWSPSLLVGHIGRRVSECICCG